MADDVDEKFDTGPRVAQPGSLDDLSLLPGEFRALRAEMRSGFEMLANRILTAMSRMEARQDDQDTRITATEQRLDAIEAQLKKRPRAKR